MDEKIQNPKLMTSAPGENAKIRLTNDPEKSSYVLASERASDAWKLHACEPKPSFTRKTIFGLTNFEIYYQVLYSDLWSYVKSIASIISFFFEKILICSFIPFLSFSCARLCCSRFWEYSRLHDRGKNRAKTELHTKTVPGITHGEFSYQVLYWI